MNKIIISVLMILVLLFVGCDDSSKNKTTTKTFIGGTSALEIKMLEGAPPPEVYDSGNFPFEVTVSVENKGEYDVPKEDVKVWLSGFYPDDFSVTPEMIKKNPDENLNGAYIDSEGNTIPGTITFVNFPGFNFKGKLQGNNDYKIWANVCYKYGTKAESNVCILEDLTEANKKENKVCEVIEKKTVKSSSAPIQIENFQETMSGSKSVRYQFEVVQRGSGAVAKFGSGCDDEIGNKDKVFIKVDSGLNGLTCTGLDGGQKTTEGYATLYGGKRLISCTQDTTGLTGDFEKKVNINLEYDYKEHIETSIRVKHTTG